MRKDVLIIGGGATGAGIARDLSLRGLDCLLLEMGDFCNGASGGNHGLLHSGARYAVKDPMSARECAQENATLRSIAPFCIEDTGGLFVSLPEDDAEFPERFLAACRASSVPVRELSHPEALREEPDLDPRMVRCIEVPDGSIDPFSLVQANVDDARRAGATLLNHCEVCDITVESGRVVRVRASSLRTGEITVLPEVVVNAAGAWAPRIAQMAGCHIPMCLDQGSMLVMDDRRCRHVLNRLRPPSNGDIVVPNHTTTILGTTSRPAASPMDITVSKQDVDMLLREASALVPSLAKARMVRSYGGVRPLLSGGGREASRSFAIFTGEVENLLSVAGGKLTTYRLMAEKVADRVCGMLGARTTCRTHLEPLGPPADLHGRSIAHARLRRKHGWNANDVSPESHVVCSCEQVLRSEVMAVLEGGDALTPTDVMRRTRAGMGYCQGLDCAFSVLDIMVKENDVRPIDSIAGLMREREKGLEHAYGDQLRQRMIREHVLMGVYGLEVN